MKAFAEPLLATFLLFAATGSACAVKPNPPGDLAVHVEMSSEPGFSKKWMESAPSNGFTIHRIQEIRQGQTAYIAFLVTGHTAGADGRPDLVVDAVIRKPDGTILAQMPACCSVRYVAGEDDFVMADPAIDVTFDTTDALGSWTIEASVKDRLAEASAKDNAQVQLRK